MENNSSLSHQRRMGLVLSGGGARGAYQAGVIRALYELNQDFRCPDLFSIVSGVSAGAINACYLAAHAQDLDTATKGLTELWKGLQSEEVFSSRLGVIILNASRILRGLSFGGLSQHLQPNSTALLDTKPLHQLLEKAIPFSQITKNLQEGYLKAICLSATDYTTSLGITFVQGGEGVPMWHRSRRYSVRAELTVDHVMASSSIPIFFPPAKVDGRDYGDGCLRNQAPLSPAVHLGANRLLVIGIRASRRLHLENSPAMRATLGRITGVIINSIFMDAIEADLERLHIINQALGQNANPEGAPGLRPVYPFYLRPSQDLAQVAYQHRARLPKIFRYLMAGLGSAEETSDLLSFLLFDPHYCSELIELGYQDTKKRAGELALFLET